MSIDNMQLNNHECSNTTLFTGTGGFGPQGVGLLIVDPEASFHFVLSMSLSV